MEVASLSDAALVVAVGRWRHEALAEIYRRHAGSVHALASRVLSDRTQAEDVTQEVFLQLWDKPTRFDSERGTLRSFLLVLAHSRAIDAVRAEGSRRRREEVDANRVDHVTRGHDQEIVDLVVAEQVREAFEALPEGERQAIGLAYYGGHTYRETAAALQEPEGTVKSRIRTGLRRLRATVPESLGER